MGALSRCPRCGTELHRASETIWFVMFVCPHCHAICIFPPQDCRCLDIKHRKRSQYVKNHEILLWGHQKQHLVVIIMIQKKDVSNQLVIMLFLNQNQIFRVDGKTIMEYGIITEIIVQRKLGSEQKTPNHYQQIHLIQIHPTHQGYPQRNIGRGQHELYN